MAVTSSFDFDCVWHRGGIDCDWMVAKAMIGPTNPAEYSDALKSLMESVRLVPKSTNPEVVLMFRTHFEELKHQCERGYSVLQGAVMDRICGIPIEVFESEYDQDKRELELAESGKRFLVCK